MTYAKTVLLYTVFSKCMSLKNVLCRRAGPAPCLGRTLELTLLAGTLESRTADPLPSHAPTAIRRVSPAPHLGRTVELALVV